VIIFSSNCRPNCAITAPKRDRIALLKKAKIANKRLARNSLIDSESLSRGKNAQAKKAHESARKIASIVFCAANGQKYQCLLGTPQAMPTT
jgi:hypothetical protein